ncbi:MAG: ribonuclease P protein component [Acidimicrobiales bacterium]
MIGRLAGRGAFARLRNEGTRHGRGPIRLVSRSDETASQAHIAFAIPRTVGNAVARNRIRRRIRAVLQELHRENPAVPARGEHLIRVSAPIDDWSHTTLRHTMSRLLDLTGRDTDDSTVAGSR